MIKDLVLTGVVQSLVLALVSYAIMMPFRLLNFSDLTAEGAYPLSGAIMATLCVANVPFMVAITFSSMAAGFLGIITGWITLHLQIHSLLAGIILSMMMYSVNLRILGQPNVAIIDAALEYNPIYLIAVLFILLILIIRLLSLFLKTEWGLRLRGVGFNPSFIQKQGFSVTRYTLLGLFMAGCLTGLSGSLMVLLQGYMDISMGTGIVIHALAALMLGEKLVGKNTLKKQIIAPLIGALLYQQIQGLVLLMGLLPCDIKLFNGLLVLAIMAIKKGEQKRGILEKGIV